MLQYRVSSRWIPPENLCNGHDGLLYPSLHFRHPCLQAVLEILHLHLRQSICHQSRSYVSSFTLNIIEFIAAHAFFWLLSFFSTNLPFLSFLLFFGFVIIIYCGKLNRKRLSVVSL